jgi:hypothetical protein
MSSPFKNISDMFKDMDSLFQMPSFSKDLADVAPGTEKEIVTTEKKSDGTSVITTITIKKSVKTIQTTAKKSDD